MTKRAVRSYVRSDGTPVRGHERRAADQQPVDVSAAVSAAHAQQQTTSQQEPVHASAASEGGTATVAAVNPLYEDHPLAEVAAEAERILSEPSVCTCGTARGGRLHCGWHFSRQDHVGDEVDRLIWLLGQLGDEKGMDTGTDEWGEVSEVLAMRVTSHHDDAPSGYEMHVEDERAWVMLMGRDRPLSDFSMSQFSPTIRDEHDAIAKSVATEQELEESLASHRWWVRAAAAARDDSGRAKLHKGGATPSETQLRAAASDPHPQVRSSVLMNSVTPIDTVQHLADNDRHEDVRFLARDVLNRRQRMTDEEGDGRGQIRATVDQLAEQGRAF